MSYVRKTWSINALATEFCQDRRTVAKKISAANIPPAETLDGARRWWLTDVAAILAPPPPGDTGKEFAERSRESYEQAKTRLTVQQADHEQLKVKQLAGELISLAEFARIQGTREGNFRAQLLSLPAKLAHIALEARTVPECEAQIQASINGVLDELADGALEEDPESTQAAESEPPSAAETDRNRVRRAKPSTDKRSKRRAGKVAH